MAETFNTEGMLDMYLFENGQLLERLQEIVLEQKDADGFDEDSINEIFRTMHTIKGSSGVMMFEGITALSHKLEDVFYYLRESHPKNVPHVELVTHVLDVADFITNEMEKLQNGESADADPKELIATLDKFLGSIKGETKKEKEKVIKENVHEEPTQFYLAPMYTEASHFFKIYLTYDEGIELANVHAYKAVYALKELAEDLLYYPEDILTDESSAEEIMENGFKILLQAQCTEEKLREIIHEGYELKKVEIFECSAKEYGQGFDSFGSEIRIDLESSVEEIEERVAREQDMPKTKKDKPMAPGDFVIESKGPGKQKSWQRINQRNRRKQALSV